MNFLIDQGLAFYWGTSEWTADQIMEAYSIARQFDLIPPTAEQPEYNMLRRNKVELEFARLYKEIGLGTTIWSPLASGMLTGKYNRGIPQDTRITLKGYEWLREGFEDENAKISVKKVAQLIPVAENPYVSTVITGASKPQQVTENMKALDFVEKLTPAVMDQIELVLDNKPEPISDYR
jgi:aryl-alcohol dehydrogenase-like predicted oxidoreductase